MNPRRALVLKDEIICRLATEINLPFAANHFGIFEIGNDGEIVFDFASGRGAHRFDNFSFVGNDGVIVVVGVQIFNQRM